MPTIRQVLAVIRADQTLGPNRKSFLIDQIGSYALKAQNQLDSQPKKIRNVKTTTQLVTIDQWEAHKGDLEQRLQSWAMSQNLAMTTYLQMVSEFRTEMRAKGKVYADFAMAFQTYMRKGYLSKTLEQCKSQAATTIQTRGISL